MKKVVMDLQTFTGRADGDVIEAKYKAIFVDASFNGSTANYVRLGKDLEEFDKALNPDVEKKKNILGEQSINVKGYEPEASVDTYYAYQGDALFLQLDTIANTYTTGTSLDTTIVEVLLDTDGTVVNAYRENVKVVPDSQKMADGKYQIPFKVYYNGGRVDGTWNNSTKTFTVGSSSGAGGTNS